MEFPIIDIRDIDNKDLQLDIAKQITAASQTWGFLLLKNHPIPLQDVDEIFSLSREFFVNVSENMKAPWPVNDKYVGYNKALTDRLANDKSSMWLSGKPGSLKENVETLPPFWRPHVEKIEAFKHTCHALVVKLLVCFALAMDLPDRNFFAKAHAEDATQFRMICYPARENKPLEETTRMSAHTDSGSVTLLFQTCPGLEVESPSGDWVAAPFLPGHILVNLGDALAFWSGGNLKATKHRVTFAGVPHDRERLSMACFGKAAPETVLEPITIDGQGKMETYESNGRIIRAGITVGELSKMIMEGIYGSSVAQKTDWDDRNEVDAAA